MRGASLILRCFAGSSLIGNNLIVSSAAAAASYSTLSLAEDGVRPLFASAVSHGAAAAFNPVFMSHSRNFSSLPSSGSSKVVSIETEEQFKDSLHKAEEESQPTVLYFTASWCGPCRLLSPMIDHLSEIYPNVSICKIDIHQTYLTGLQDMIHSVPTLHFYQNGKKAREVVGADVELLKSTMKELYQYLVPAHFFNLSCGYTEACANRPLYLVGLTRDETYHVYTNLSLRKMVRQKRFVNYMARPDFGEPPPFTLQALLQVLVNFSTLCQK